MVVVRSRFGSSSVLHIAVEIQPPTLDPGESAAFAHDVTFAMAFELRAEVDYPGGVVLGAGDGVNDLQPTPGNAAVQIDSPRARADRNTSRQLIKRGRPHIAGAVRDVHREQREGHIPGNHLIS